MRKPIRFSRITRIICVTLLALVLVAIVVRLRTQAFPEFRYSNGKIFQIEAVTFGTNHVIGINDWWNYYLRKALPNSVMRYLEPAHGQSRFTTSTPTLSIWVFARSAATGQYVDCQGMKAFFTDEHGDVYPADRTWHFGLAHRLTRQAFIFEVFPRWSKRLKLNLSPRLSTETCALWLPNPAPRAEGATWRPENIPAVHSVDDLQFNLESLAIQTNGGPGAEWEPFSLHWKPVIKLAWKGQSTDDWEPPAWEAMDPAGNCGRTLGLHEPLLKFRVTSRPKPEAVIRPSHRWQLPMMEVPTTTNRVLWNTNRFLGTRSVFLYGLFPPGTYTFTQGMLTNDTSVSGGGGWVGSGKEVKRGVWVRSHHYGDLTNHMVFLRREATPTEQRIAVCLRDEQNRAVWSQSDDDQEGVLAFVFHLSPETQRVAMDIVLQEPVQTDFVVKPPAN